MDLSYRQCAARLLLVMLQCMKGVGISSGVCEGTVYSGACVCSGVC